MDRRDAGEVDGLPGWFGVPALRDPKFPDIQASLEGNTQVPGTTSSEPLLPC